MRVETSGVIQSSSIRQALSNLKLIMRMDFLWPFSMSTVVNAADLPESMCPK
jgi:hypothetical protein